MWLLNPVIYDTKVRISDPHINALVIWDVLQRWRNGYIIYISFYATHWCKSTKLISNETYLLLGYNTAEFHNNKGELIRPVLFSWNKVYISQCYSSLPRWLNFFKTSSSKQDFNIILNNQPIHSFSRNVFNIERLQRI